MIFDGLDDKKVAEMAREDLHAAKESRMEVEARKLAHYRLYRLFRKELQDGGKGERSNGPFGWSKLSVPIVFWIVETILPRVSINAPQLVVKAKNPQSMRFQQAKQLRLNHQMQEAHIDEEMLLTLKQFLILGDGPVKTSWDAEIAGPRMLAIDWFDWFLSPDAARWHDAEVMFHRTWHTKRSLSALAERDSNRRDTQTGERLPPLYDHAALKEIAYGSAYREANDSAYAERRDAAGLGTTSWPAQDGPVALVECHYRDGSMCVIAGDESPLAVRVEREPVFKDQRGRPFRPFAVFQNTPDLFQPYGISDAEMVADHQHESTTLKNQAMDVGTGNLNAPKGYNRNKVSGAELQSAWGQPNGIFGVDGNPNELVVQFPPGQLSGDLERLLEHNRREAQETVGANDVVQGIAAASDQTATEVASLREEANLRWALKRRLVEFGMVRVAQNFDKLDRAVSRNSVTVPLEQGFELGSEQRGITRIGEDAGFARIDTAANAPGMDYDLEIEAGSMVPTNKSEEAEKVRALVSDVAGLVGAFPQLGPMVNAPELIKMMIEATGQDPDRVLMDPAQVAAATPGMGAPGAPQGAPQPGEEPVGPPIPIGQGAANGAVPAGVG